MSTYEAYIAKLNSLKSSALPTNESTKTLETLRIVAWEDWYEVIDYDGHELSFDILDKEPIPNASEQSSDREDEEHNSRQNALLTLKIRRHKNKRESRKPA